MIDKTTITNSQSWAHKMDIPQQPKSISATPTITTTTRIPEKLNPVSVEALNLEKDKVYQAIVSKLVDNKILTTPAKSENLTNSSNEWLLKLNGKSILITSEKALQLGQTLRVKLNPSTQALTVLPTTTAQPSSIQSPNNSLLSNTSITLLLSAINHVMPRQVSLETGLTALEIFSKQNDSQQVSNQAKLILLMLAKQAPTEKLFTTAEKTTSTTTNFLKDSGVFFESSAKQQPNNPNSLKLQITQIQEALNLKQNTSTPNTSQTLQSAQLIGALQNSISETNKSTTSSIDFNTIRTALLAKLQLTLPTPQGTPTNLPPATAPNNANPSTPVALSPLRTLLNNITPSLNTSHNIESSNVHNDLKGLLLSVTAALKTDNTKLAERPHIEALAQFDLLKNPFNFPHFAHQPASVASSKAEALIADQQFTTGQLLKLIAGMLNRIQFNQLNSLYQSHTNSNDSNNVQSWFFELPVTNPNNQFSTFDLRIDKEEDPQQAHEQNDDKQEVQWKLALSFKFEQLGAIYVQVTLAPPVISSTIWADRPETLALINREKPHFQSKLSELGLEVGDISCQKGQPTHDKTRLDRSLVDIKA
ncbi:MAG: hypothetical protein ACJASG_001339 [Oleiphilaceae bacterium]|jgi:hypothetical protein